MGENPIRKDRTEGSWRSPKPKSAPKEKWGNLTNRPKLACLVLDAMEMIVRVSVSLGVVLCFDGIPPVPNHYVQEGDCPAECRQASEKD